MYVMTQVNIQFFCEVFSQSIELSTGFINSGVLCYVTCNYVKIFAVFVLLIH